MTKPVLTIPDPFIHSQNSLFFPDLVLTLKKSCFFKHSQSPGFGFSQTSIAFITVLLQPTENDYVKMSKPWYNTTYNKVNIQLVSAQQFSTEANYDWRKPSSSPGGIHEVYFSRRKLRMEILLSNLCVLLNLVWHQSEDHYSGFRFFTKVKTFFWLSFPFSGLGMNWVWVKGIIVLTHFHSVLFASNLAVLLMLTEGQH